MSAASYTEPCGGSGLRTAGAAHRAAGWLGLAAAPTFALMALVTGVLGGGPMAMLCSVAPGIPIDGMVLMYGLMSAFHLVPWLNLISGQPSDDRRP
jgi:hypothetical protein